MSDYRLFTRICASGLIVADGSFDSGYAVSFIINPADMKLIKSSFDYLLAKAESREVRLSSLRLSPGVVGTY